MATKLNIRLKANADASKPQQIAQQIGAAIESGKLKPGESLPSERALSEQLGVNRKTVRAAFAQLADERLIETAGTSNRRVRGGGKKSAAPTGAAKKTGQPGGAKKGRAKS
ncbi:MAG: winged helix-turn-helix domain-containing protein [Acidobacteriota bacterium]|nr:winged helix-turn-helix domain-containing protein [Acidobacteriota bacterium]MDQ3753378.1 winged helix-turn-helix domain-containing protein [Acidobacteriota bacterium]